MPVYDMNLKLIEGFINERVTRNGLDGRTEKAYRLDLEHFCVWLEERRSSGSFSGENVSQNVDKGEKAGIAGTEAAGRESVAGTAGTEAAERESVAETETAISISGETAAGGMSRLEDLMEIYLDYLVMEKKLSSATVCRKSRVFGYYLSYLSGHGIIGRHRALRPARRAAEEPKDRSLLSKKESDAFFAAMNREYEGLASEFRRRICLRDMVMMELLFYHKIEISELLRLETADYDQKSGYLTIRRKRGEESQVYLFSQELRGKMKEWLRERNEIQSEEEYDGRMFVSKFGRPLSMKMVIKIFDKYRGMAGIEREFTPKDLKESCMKQYARELVMERWG